MKNRLLILLLLLLLGSGASAQLSLSPMVDSIPMRDSARLAADIYLPDSTQSWPVILIQTPYNRLITRFSGLPLGIGKSVQTSNYAFVTVDWRCFWGSGGACIANPQRGEDGYDVVEWVAQQPWCDGNIGTWGPSALGGIQYQTARENPPSLNCICPLVAASQTSYEQYYPGGCLREEYLLQLDGLGFGLSPLVLANQVDNLLWQFTETGSYYPDEIKVPVLSIGGWYDHNVDQQLDLFEGLITIGDPNVRAGHKLLFGPWAHGGNSTAQVGDTIQGQLAYPGAAGHHNEQALKFFDYYLRGIQNGWPSEPVYKLWQLGDDQWVGSGTWPPNVSATDYFLKPAGNLSTGAPVVASGSANITYDPLDPSPTIGGATLKLGLDQGPFDQAPQVESRSDVLIFTTDVLTSPLAIQGKPSVELYASSDRKDTDFMVRLTDVYPDNRSMLLMDGVVRGRFRKGFTASDTLALVPGTPDLFTIDLPHTNITLPPGHRLRLIVSSSNYPRFARNFNDGGAMYTPVDTLIATNTLYFNSSQPSRLILPVGTSVDREEEMEAMFQVYPNPSRGIFSLESKNQGPLAYRLMGPEGKIYQIGRTTGPRSQIGMENLPNGIYLLQVEDLESGRSSTQKIVLLR